VADESLPARPSPFTGEIPSYYRRNAWAFALDMGFFQIAVAFFGGATVLPAFIATLTRSEVMVGVASGITTGAWMLPQLFIASYVAGMARKQPFVARMAWLSRPLLLIIAAAAYWLAVPRPSLTLAITLFTIAAFFFMDAVVSVPWFDLMARGLPSRRRGRVQGLAQVWGGLGGFAAGFLVRHILSDASPWQYPANFSMLFTIGAVVLCGSSAAISFIYEPASTEAETAARATPLSLRQTLAGLPALLRADPPFVIMIAVRLLAGFVSVSTSFFILYATRVLGFATADTGLFISAQVLGTLGSGLLMSFVQDRYGPRTHLRLNVVISILPAALALVAGLVAPRLGVGAPALRSLYLGVFFFLGVYGGSMGWPYFNWIMEHAEERQRPLYISISNTIGATFMLAPVLGGGLVSVFSYPAAFVASILFAVAALALSTRMLSTRKS
jgi:MFS family permease